MKVILLADVPKLGKKGDVKDVSDGYAKNYLIARGLAVPESGTSKKILEKQKEEEKLLDEQKREEARQLAKQLEDITLEFKVKAKDGRVSGSISTKQIEEELKKKGIIIDKRKIKDNSPLNELGTFDVKVELYKDVLGTIKVKLTEE